jgi:AcrR family transcriptional regulator
MQENHRTRVGAERREKMRLRLLESALVVLSEKGPGAPVIDDIIKLAGVSRGSFYNYFKTNDELLEAVAVALSNDIIRIVDPVVRQHTDPVARISLGLRLLLHAVQQSPALAAFIGRLRWPNVDSPLEGIGYLSRDIVQGMESGDLSVTSFRVALDVFVGTFFCAANTLTVTDVPDSYPEEITRSVLLALGVRPAKAMKAVQLPLPDISFAGTEILSNLMNGA